MFSKFEGNINLSNERIRINKNERCDTTTAKPRFTRGNDRERKTSVRSEFAFTRRRLLN